MSELEIKGSVESLHLEPGDKVLISLEASTHRQFHDWIAAFREPLREAFPDNEIVFLANGLKISKVVAK